MIIPGPAGDLEAELTLAADNSKDNSKDNSNRFAVLCHPHPQYGGDMHDLVLASLETALLGQSVSCLRFNFRGVGASAGDHTSGEGELDDLQAVISWLQAHHNPHALVLAGYSFGAGVVWRSLDEQQPEHVLLVAPPSRFMAFPERKLPNPVDIFAGDQDSYVDIAGLADINGAVTHVISGADHFFMGHHDDLQQAVLAAVRGWTV